MELTAADQEWPITDTDSVFTLLKTTLFCGAYETIPQRLGDSLGCRHCYANKNALACLLNARMRAMTMWLFTLPMSYPKHKRLSKEMRAVDWQDGTSTWPLAPAICSWRTRTNTLAKFSSNIRRWTAAHPLDRSTCCFHRRLVDGTPRWPASHAHCAIQSGVPVKNEGSGWGSLTTSWRPRTLRHGRRQRPVVVLDEMIPALNSFTGVNLTVDSCCSRAQLTHRHPVPVQTTDASFSK